VTGVSYRGLRQRLLAAVALVLLSPVLGLYGYLFAVNTVGLDVLWPLAGKRWYGSVYVTQTTAGAFVVTCFVLIALGYRLRRDAAWRALDPTPVERTHHPALVDRVDELAATVGVPAPTVATSDADAPTAVTLGIDPRNRTLVLTDALRERLDDDELDAVVAHELAHQRNDDVFGTAASIGLFAVLRPIAVPTVVGRTAELMLGYGRREFPLLRTVVTVAYLPVSLCFLPTYLCLRYAVDRGFLQYREYVADTAAGAVVDDPEALASALESLAAYDGESPGGPYVDALATVPFVTAASGIHGASEVDVTARQPPTSERVARLRALAETES
jgi:heat shock protein HtpX